MVNMTKRLVLRGETLTELTTTELEAIAGAEATKLCQFTIGGSCGIVCITLPVQCLTDTCPTRSC